MQLLKDFKRSIKNASTGESDAGQRYIDIKKLDSLLGIENPNDTISLAINIRFFGILNPLNAFYCADDGKYYLINGCDKLSALYLLGRTKVLCNVITDRVTCDGMVIDEYLLKANRNLFHACIALEYLTIRRGYTINEISSMSGISIATISNILKLAGFSPEEKRLLDVLEVDETTCLEIAKIDNANVRAEILSHIKQSKANMKNVFKKSCNQKTFHVDGRFITNTVNQLVSKLAVMGFDTELELCETNEDAVYTIKVKKASRRKQ